MKKIFLSLAISATLSIASTAVNAENTGRKYLGAQYGVGIFPVGVKLEKPKATLLKGGKYLSDSFAFESRIGSGSGKKDIGSNQTLGLELLLGVYGVKHFNVSEASSLYSVIGVSFVQVIVEEYEPGEQVCTSTQYAEFRYQEHCEEAGRTTIGNDHNGGVGLSFGVGADIGITDNAALNIEYMQYLNQSSFVYDTIGFGLKYIF